MSNPWLNPEYESKISKGITMDITHRCLLQCTKCMRSYFPGLWKRGKDMPLKDFKVILESNVKELDICGQMGDPIYHPKFIDILKMCAKYDKKIVIHTNGHGKKASFWNEIIKIMNNNKSLNIDWIFGLDGLPNQSHIYRVNQDGEAVWEVMKKLAKHSNNINWQYIVFRYNQNNIDVARQLAKDNNVIFKLFLSSRWDGGTFSKPDKNGRWDPLRPNKKYTVSSVSDLYG